MARNDRKFHWLSFDAKKSKIGPKTQKLGPIFEKSCFFKIAKKWPSKKGRIEKNAFECEKVQKSWKCHFWVRCVFRGKICPWTRCGHQKNVSGTFWGRKTYFAETRFFLHCRILCILKKYPSKNGHYLETRFLSPRPRTTCRPKKKIFAQKRFFFMIIHMKVLDPMNVHHKWRCPTGA